MTSPGADPSFPFSFSSCARGRHCGARGLRLVSGGTRSLERFSARTFRQPFHSDKTRRHPPSQRRRHRTSKIRRLQSSIVIRRFQRPSRCDDAQPLSRSDVPTQQPRHQPRLPRPSHRHNRLPQRRQTFAGPTRRLPFLPHRVPSLAASKEETGTSDFFCVPRHRLQQTRHNDYNLELHQRQELDAN